jgi:hypothetical protein
MIYYRYGGYIKKNDRAGINFNCRNTYNAQDSLPKTYKNNRAYRYYDGYRDSLTYLPPPDSYRDSFYNMNYGVCFMLKDQVRDDGFAFPHIFSKLLSEEVVSNHRLATAYSN